MPSGNRVLAKDSSRWLAIPHGRHRSRRASANGARADGGSVGLVPGYVEERIRRPPPDGLSVVAGSTPVVSFGRVAEARIATVGINPSRVEFLSRQGEELCGESRRLATLRSLAVPDLSTASLPIAAQVLADCDSYFSRNPYRRWFDQLDAVLQKCGASYYDGSACHLDLVQWATDPVWGKLPRTQRAALLAEDRNFLHDQLAHESVSTLLLNGRTVIETFSEAMACRLRPERDRLVFGRSSTRLVRGWVGDITVVGWTVNLQSSFGVTNDLRNRLADRVATLTGLDG